MSYPSARTQAVLGALGIGVLAAIHLVALLTFLNPHLPFGPRLGLQLLALYAPLLAAVSLVLHLPALLRAGELGRRALPWSLTVVLLLAAILAGFHASHLAYYLPSGINVRLIKAAVWLALGAVAAFYTALLHSLHDRPYGMRSRSLLWFLAVASLVVVVERREAYEPPRSPAPLPSAAELDRPLHLLVVGLDSATMDVLLPLAEQGRLPFFDAVLRNGAAGRLGSLTPTIPAPLWTSLATGKYPYKHGIVAPATYRSPALAEHVELRILPRGILFPRWGLPTARRQPVSAADRRAAPLWATFSRLDIATRVLDWPLATSVDSAASGDAAGTAVAPSGLSTPEDRPRALFVRIPGLSAPSRLYFGGYFAHQLEGASEPRYVAAAGRLAAAYEEVDSSLDALWRQLPEPRLLAVASPYGISAPPWWRRVLAEASDTPLLSGNPSDADGVVALLGTGVRSGVTLRGASLVDLVPTLLYALGLPTARDLDGRVLTEAFHPGLLSRRPVTFVPSYEALLEITPRDGADEASRSPSPLTSPARDGDR